MSIAYVNDAHAAGTSTVHSPTYSSTAGNTLIITGDIFDASLSGVTISSITDTAGNTWHFSTSNSTKPPYADEAPAGETLVTFIAWTINAKAITSVSVTLSANCFANIDISEWSGIGYADVGAISHVSSGATGTTIPSGSLTCSTTGELVIGCMDSSGAAAVTAPAGTTKLPNASPNAFFPYELSQSGTVSWNWGCSANPGDYTSVLMAFAPQTWTVLQSAKAQTVLGTAIENNPATFGTALSSGSVMLAITHMSCGVAGHIVSVKDGNNNSFTKIGEIDPVSSFPAPSIGIWALATPAGDVGTKPTITATPSTLGTFAGGLIIQEISGISAAGDGTPGTVQVVLGTGGGSTGNPTYSSNAAGEYLLSVYGDANGDGRTWTAPGGYTTDANSFTNGNSSGGNLAVCYKDSTGAAESGAFTASSASASDSAAVIMGALDFPGGTTHTAAAALSLTPTLAAGTVHTATAGAALSLTPAFRAGGQKPSSGKGGWPFNLVTDFVINRRWRR